MKRVRIEYEELSKTEKDIQKPGWFQKGVYDGVTVMIRHEEDHSCSNTVSKEIDLPFEIVTAFLVEFDLLKHYAPFVE